MALYQCVAFLIAMSIAMIVFASFAAYSWQKGYRDLIIPILSTMLVVIAGTATVSLLYFKLISL